MSVDTWLHEHPSETVAEMLSQRPLLKAVLVVLLSGAAGYLGLRLTFTRPMTGFEVLVPVSSTATKACLVHALGAAFGPARVTINEYSTTVQHDSCFVSGRGNAWLTYGIVVRDGHRYLSISDDWRAIDRVTVECAAATGTEIRRAIDAFAIECDPGLVGVWSSRCELSGADLSENSCPDPQGARIPADAGASPPVVDAR